MSKPDAKAALRAQILATATVAPIAVGVPGWDGVYLRPLSVSDAEDISAATDGKHRVSRSLARMLCDADGALLFDPHNEDDLRAIGALDQRRLAGLNQRVAELNASSDTEALALGNG